MKQDISVDLAGGKRISFETGKLAKQAHGSVVVRIGDNVVLATATANPDPREGIDFFPLTVDYREYTYAGGRIPGGFIKREGRPSEREILTSRQIDRPVRPLFAEGFKCETQVIAFVLSADTENDPDVAGINGASAALTISDIPFLGPIGAVRVGLVNGQFIINPTYSEMSDSLLNIMVVGTADGIVMIESGAKEVKEETVVDAIEFAHTEIKKICAAINELRDKAGKPKRAVTPPEFDQAYYDGLKKKIGADLADRLDTQKHPKAESYTLVRELKKGLQAAIPEDDEAGQAKLKTYYETLRERIFRLSIRFATSGLKSAFSPGHMALQFSLAAKRRRWSPPRSAPATTCSASKDSRARPRSASCFTITSRRSQSAKWRSCAALDVARLVTALLRSGLSRRSSPAKTSGPMPCESSPTFSSRTAPRRWQRFAARHCR